MKKSCAPSDGRAPIMTRKIDFPLAELIGNRDQIGNQLWHSVGGYAGRLAAEVVSTLIRNNNAKTGARQRLNLSVPPVPKFWETVQQNNNRAVPRPGGHGVKTQASVLKVNSCVQNSSLFWSPRVESKICCRIVENALSPFLEAS